MGRKSKYEASLKTKVVIEAQREASTLSELAKKYGGAPAHVTSWRQEFLAKSSSVFEDGASSGKELKKVVAERDRLLKKVGQLTLEVDFFCGAYETYCQKKK